MLSTSRRLVDYLKVLLDLLRHMFHWRAYLIIIRWELRLLLFIFSFICQSFISCFQNLRWWCQLQYRSWFILCILSFDTHNSIRYRCMSWWQTRWFKGLFEHTIILIVLHHIIRFNSWMSIRFNYIWFIEVVHAFGQGTGVDATTGYASTASVRHLAWEDGIVDFFKFSLGSLLDFKEFLFLVFDCLDLSFDFKSSLLRCIPRW